MRTKTYKISGKPEGGKIAASIDVHKYKLHVRILGRFSGHIRPLGEQPFVNDERGKDEMCRYLTNYYPDEIVMEKTGVLSDTVFTALSKYRGWKGNKPHITVVKPDTVKRFPGEPHTDPRSADTLAVLGLSGLLRSIYIPSEAGRKLRQLTREAEGLTKQSTALINEMKDILAGWGYTLPDFSLTDAWGLDLLRLLIMKGIDGNINRIYELIEKGHVNLHSASRKAILKRKSKYIGYTHLSIAPFDARLLGRKLFMLLSVEASKKSNTEQIEDHVNEYPLLKEKVRRIAQVPGISVVGATVITAEVDDPSRFATSRKFQLYAGRAVAPDRSGEYVGKSRMTKRCNHHLKRVFRQAGITACFSVNEDSDVRRYALRQLGKHSRKPVIAAANTSTKIVNIVYKIMHDGVIYDPFHETRQKNNQLPPSMPGEDPSWNYMLKYARRRATRFRNFTRRAVEALPDGDIKDLLARVLDSFDEVV